MLENTLPQEILIYTGRPRPDDRDLELRGLPRALQVQDLTAVNLTNLQGQVNIFLQQLDQIMTSDTDKKVGAFRLDEFEVSVGIVVEAKGGVKLALLANAEAGTGINAGLKFVFKRS
jgi:hypothetical protein